MQKFRSTLLACLDRLERLSDTFGGNTVALLTVSLMLAAGMLVLNDRYIVSSNAHTDRLALLDQLLAEEWKTLESLAAAESAQRGYLLTRSEKYFKPYDDATREITAHMQNITTLLNHTHLIQQPEIQQTMNALIDSIAKKSAEMSVTIDFAKQRQFDKALAVVRLDSGVQGSQNVDVLAQRLERQVLDSRHALAERRNHTRRMMRWIVMACPLIFVGLVVLVIRRLLRELAEKATLTMRISDENAEYERNIQTLTTRLQRQALEAQTNIEQERYQLSRELHDELGSLLTAIKMDISWASKQLKETAPQVTEKLKKTNQYLDRSINFKREMVQNLHPAMIKSFGLIASLQNLLDEAAHRNQWQLDLIMPEQELQMNETLSLIIYRVVQESLNNCSKYAKASQVAVHLMHDEHTIKLEISDNGQGFEMQQLTARNTGLKGMRNRVESIGGRYEVSSAPGQGVYTRVLLPYLTDDLSPERGL